MAKETKTDHKKEIEACISVLEKENKPAKKELSERIAILKKEISKK
jgi:hypothetical protein